MDVNSPGEAVAVPHNQLASPKSLATPMEKAFYGDC